MRPRTDTFDVPAGFVRVPGLFRRAELEPIDKIEAGFHVVDAGSGPDGDALVVVFQRERPPRRHFDPQAEVVPISVEITLPDAPEGRTQLTVRYCDTCHRWGPRHSVHLCGANWHSRLDHLLHELAADPVALAEGRAP